MDLSVNKSGICWAEFSFNRHSRGLEIFVRTVPEIESFIKSLGSGKVDPSEAYGREWFPIGAQVLMINRTDSKDVVGPGWTISRVAEPFSNPKENKVNLSFLKIVGVGSPEGVRFGANGPFAKDYVRDLSQSIVRETSNLIKSYIVPLHINLRISSQEA